MKLSAARIRRFLQAPDPAIHVVLIYGPDHGLVRERADAIEAAHLGEVAGPFSQTLLNAADLKSDNALLQDSICAQSLGGGERIVRLKTSADQSAKAVKGLLSSLSEKALVPAALLLIEAGDLSPRSQLRKTVEQENHLAVAIACYAPGPGDLRQLALDEAKSNALNFDQGALEHLVERLPADRAIARSEIEKLVLYALNNKGGTIGVNDINAIITDAGDSNLDAFALAVADGDAAQADRLLGHAVLAGQSPIALLRALQRHVLRLYEAKAISENRGDVKAAMASLRPPVFFARQARFSAQLNEWPLKTLTLIGKHCLHTEIQMKRSGAMPENLLARLIIKIMALKPVL